jgi:predicted alpha/beta-fold hydrolase
MLTDSVQVIEQSSNGVAIENLAFYPLPGLRSPHLQTILPTFFSEIGEEPPFAPFFIHLADGDALYCKMSTPPNWNLHQKTVVLLHGLGGSDASSYMIRMSRKFYQSGYRCLRINLRGSGEGVNFARRPYHGGASHDILETIQTLKKQAPTSPIILVGYSLGGNIALKLLAELKERASELIEMAITICSPIDLAQTMELLLQPVNRLYHRYYVKSLKLTGARWIGNNAIRSIPDFDNMVTAPRWGFRDAADYYQQSSSRFLLPHIQQTCHLIFAMDDPFVDYRSALQPSLSPKVKLWLSPYGGHMGFWGWVNREHRYHWLDNLLIKMVQSHSINKNKKE